MFETETLHPAELSDADAEAWRALCLATPAFASPLLGPDFTRAVGRVRTDARVSLWRRDGRVVAALPHHLRPGGYGRAIAAPLSDYHALVSAPGVRLDAEAALVGAGLNAWRFTGLLDPHQVFADRVAARSEAYVIRLDDTSEAYLEALRAASAKRFKNHRRLDHKLEREVGTVEIVAPDPSREAFDRLLTWKRAQLHRTGAHDFLRAEWTQGLLDTLFEGGEGPLRGLCINLYAGGQHVAGHFGVQLGEVFHPWIASIDPAYAPWSPGQVFLLRAIAAMPGLGLKVYDLGPGHAHYKAPFARDRIEIGEGLAVAAGAGGRAAQTSERMWTAAGARRDGLVGRLRRRLDNIASVELSLGGRALGVAGAIASRARRRSAETM